VKLSLNASKNYTANDNNGCDTTLPTFTVSQQTSSVALAISSVIDGAKNAVASAGSNLPLCSLAQVHEGRWVSKLLQPHEVPYKTNYKVQRCIPGATKESDLTFYETAVYNNRTDGAIQSFEWIPHDSKSCQFEKWSTESLCRALTTNTGHDKPETDVVIIGDSLSEEFFASVKHLVSNDPNAVIDNDAGTVSNDCGIKLYHRRMDYVYENKMRWELTEKNPTYAVFNFGSHYLEDAKHLPMLENMAGIVREWQDNCKLEHNHKPCLFVWKTTVPGHRDCNLKDSRYEYPAFDFLNWTFPLAEQWIVEHPTIFHWDDFKRQNTMAIEILRTAGVDFVVLDAYRVNILRPDGHSYLNGNVDCLHNCLGSKVDVQAQLLLHIIKLHKAGMLSSSAGAR